MQHFLSAVAGFKAKLPSRFFAAILACYAASIGVASAQEIFNVSNEAELIDALDRSSTNELVDRIDLGGNEIELTKTLEVISESRRGLDIVNGTIRPVQGGAFRLFHVTGSTLILRDMTFENARHITSGLEPSALSGGAAVFFEGSNLFIFDSTFTNNQTTGDGNVAGGAILVSRARLVIETSTFENNHALTTGENAEASGGAIAISGGTTLDTLVIEDSIFNDNTASRGGAIAMLNQEEATSIRRSTFSGNDADSAGGAIWARSDVRIELSTFYGNSAGTGGGALFFQPLLLETSGESFLSRNTLVNNMSRNGVGQAIQFENRLNQLSLAGNLIIGNGADQGSHCSEINGPSPELFAFAINNLSDDSSCGDVGFSLVQNNSALFANGSAQLEDNGGPTPTVALGFTSEAIDEGGVFSELGRFSEFSSVECTASTETDQRGVAVTEACDIGSFEFLVNAFDEDADGVFDNVDNCPTDPNPGQEDDVRPGFGGDVCDDVDTDGVEDAFDNCPLVSNPEVLNSDDFAQQPDIDGDGDGDACDDDRDGDGVDNDDDLFPDDVLESADTDGDGVGNVADNDDDGDGQLDTNEALCGSNPLDSGSVSDDADRDNIPDCADLDNDNDRQSDVDEVMCGSDPFDSGSVSLDTDGDNVLDCIDLDDDNDGILDDTDNCPVTANPGQEDANGNGIGDACDVQNDVQPVTVFQHVNFAGNSLSVGAGDVSIGDLRASSLGNDQISSIEIAPGYEVTACQHGGLRGRCETFTGTVSDLRGISFNDVISSIRVSQSTLPVTVYQHVSFGGNSLNVGEGDVSIGDLRASSVGNDQISSIKIAPGYEVTACQHGGFRGRCETFTGTVSDLRGISFNDAISSLTIQQQ